MNIFFPNFFISCSKFVPGWGVKMLVFSYHRLTGARCKTYFQFFDFFKIQLFPKFSFFPKNIFSKISIFPKIFNFFQKHFFKNSQFFPKRNSKFSKILAIKWSLLRTIGLPGRGAKPHFVKLWSSRGSDHDFAKAYALPLIFSR